jgi:hypothetical protein
MSPHQTNTVFLTNSQGVRGEKKKGKKKRFINSGLNIC